MVGEDFFELEFWQELEEFAAEKPKRQKESVKLAMVQMSVSESKEDNLRRARDYIEKAAQAGADMVILPEMFCCPYETKNFPVYAESFGGPAYQAMADAAKEFGVYLVAGSMPEIEYGYTPAYMEDALIEPPEWIYNTSYVFDPEGRCLAQHRKVHLFDIDVKGGQHFMESETLSAGHQMTVFETPFGQVGLCICYDIRFPELARLMALQGADIIICPAAFNMTTGLAHWELLFRARAVDNQVYTVGVAPARDVNGPYVSYANSILVSPWGEVLTRFDANEEMRIVELPLPRVDEVREQIPVLKQRRTDLYELKLTR